MGAKGLLQPKRLPSTGGRGAVRHSLHAYLQILHDSIAQQSSSLSPTDFDWKRDGGWEEFEPIGSLEMLYLTCLQNKLWQQYVYFIQEWVKMYVVLEILTVLRGLSHIT